MREEKSCGLIVHKEGEILLLHYPGGHWGSPKGHVEKEDEDEQETALRELEEETGIKDVEMVPGFRQKIIYTYKAGGVKRRKTVVFFLCETNTEKVTLSHEHKGYEWLPSDDAVERTTYEDERGVLKKALEHLKNHDSSLNDFF